MINIPQVGVFCSEIAKTLHCALVLQAAVMSSSIGEYQDATKPCLPSYQEYQGRFDARMTFWGSMFVPGANSTLAGSCQKRKRDDNDFSLVVKLKRTRGSAWTVQSQVYLIQKIIGFSFYFLGEERREDLFGEKVEDQSLC